MAIESIKNNRPVSTRRLRRGGFTIFFAVLVAALALSVGLVIYDLLLRSLSLSQMATQSQYAVYAADTGAECALYWDLKYTDLVSGDADQSAFATSSDYTSGGTGAGNDVVCNSQNITTASAISGFSNTPNTSNSGWYVVAPDATTATTTFWISMGTTAAAPCAKVEVGKKGVVSQTTIVSHGYNTCSAAGTLRLERSIQVSY
jgi:hypothetical protein